MPGVRAEDGGVAEYARTLSLLTTALAVVALVTIIV